jgi:DHA3 family multidrug efflux protein-like MFS transporter
VTEKHTAAQTDPANTRTFYHLLVNTLVSGVTNMTVWFALIFYVYLETRSVMATSIVSGIYLAAVALSGFWFGSRTSCCSRDSSR